MAYYPTITDNTSNLWNLPPSDGDATMDAYVFNKNTGGQIAYIVFIIKNSQTVGSNSFLQVDDINLNGSSVTLLDNGLQLDPTDGGNVELGADTSEGDKLKTPGTDASSTASSNFSEANRILCVPSTGDVTVDDLGDETAPYRIIPIYKASDLINGESIPDNSYAAFIVSYNPTQSSERNVNNILNISTSAGAFSASLSLAANNSFVFGARYGSFNTSTGELDDPSSVFTLAKNSYDTLDFGMLPVGFNTINNVSVESDIDKTFSFYDISTDDSAYNFGDTLSSSYFSTADSFLESTLLMQRIYDSTNYTLNELSAVALADVHAAGTVLYSKFKLTANAKSKSVYNVTNGVSNTTRSESDNTRTKSLLGLLEVPTDTGSNGSYGVYVTYGVYDRLTLPVYYSDYVGYYNQDAESATNVPKICKTSDTATSLYFGGYFNLDLMFTFNNFGIDALNTAYAISSLDVYNELAMYVTSFNGVSGSSDMTKYTELASNTYAASIHNDLDSGTAAATASTHFATEAGLTAYQKSLAVRVKLIAQPTYTELYHSEDDTGSEYNAIDSAIVSGTLEKVFGKYECKVRTSEPSEGADPSKLIHYLPTVQYYKVLAYPEYTEIEFKNKTSSNLEYNLVDNTIDDGTSSIQTASNWYGVNSATPILNTSAAWDGSNKYIGSSGAYKKNGSNTTFSSGSTYHNPIEPYILDQQGNDIHSFTPSSNYYKSNATLNPTDDTWEAFLTFDFNNTGSHNIYVYDVEVVAAKMLPSPNLALSPNGEDLWYVGSGTGGNSTFTDINHKFKTGDSQNFYGMYTHQAFNHEKDRFNCFIPSNLYVPSQNDKTNKGLFSVRFLGTNSNTPAGDYYKSVRVRYYKDIYSNRKSVSASGSVSSKSFYNRRKHEAIMLVKVTVEPEAILQVGDADTTVITSGQDISVPTLSVG